MLAVPVLFYVLQNVEGFPPVVWCGVVWCGVVWCDVMYLVQLPVQESLDGCMPAKRVTTFCLIPNAFV